MFYTYRQNNSGGRFKTDVKRGIGITVIIEASDAKEANDKAERIGLYFDGCNSGSDCDCCGDRWYAAYGEGDPIPSIYGRPVEQYSEDIDWTPDVSSWFIHYADGTIKAEDLSKKIILKAAGLK